MSRGNWYQLDTDIGRYLNACQKEAESCTNFSIAGPDGTKVGTDLNIFCANVMYQNTGRVAVVPPQALLIFCLSYLLQQPASDPPRLAQPSPAQPCPDQRSTFQPAQTSHLRQPASQPASRPASQPAGWQASQPSQIQQKSIRNPSKILPNPTKIHLKSIQNPIKKTIQNPSKTHPKSIKNPVKKTPKIHSKNTQNPSKIHPKSGNFVKILESHNPSRFFILRGKSWGYENRGCEISQPLFS